MQDYVRSEIAEVFKIYSVLFPGKRIRLLLREGKDPAIGTAVRMSANMHFDPADHADGFLGCVERQPDASSAGAYPETVAVRVTIPRRPTHGEATQTEPDWSPRGRVLRMIYALSPKRYEQLRYFTERVQERRSRRHLWSPLQRQIGSQTVRALERDGVLGADSNAVTPSEAAPAILVGVHWLEVGGAEALAFDTIHWALAAGLRVFVVASTPAQHRLRDRLPDEVTFLRLDRYLPHGDWPAFLERFLPQENVRLIHIHHCTPLYGALAHIRVVAPWVKVIDSTHIIEYADGGYARVSGVWTNFIDVHHAISRQLQQMYVGRFNVPVGKVRLGRMLRRQGDGTEVAAPPPARMQAGRDSLAVTFVGRLYYQKRPVLAVLMMKALAGWARKRNVKLAVNMVGDGPFAAACDRLVRRYKLHDIVRRFPANADVPALLGQSDLLLLPSSNEGLALVCYEAVEHGAIPVSSDVGGQAEIVPPDLLLPREPAKALRRLIEIVDRLWSDQDFLARQVETLHRAYSALASDPASEDVLMPIYRAAAAEAARTEDRPQAAPKRSNG
ncbi:glycosyltransferase [Defluviimonas sp. SAOS-178_SWC]|uniref:glycosyltransferase n=1 Tax=Defluviimonas sp. SAOS-178_SWC TaxID=3121287 RepID=UPI0032219842